MKPLPKINGDQLLENAELVNIQRVIAEPANVTTVNDPLLLAINDDPHLIVAFDDSVDLTAASRVRFGTTLGLGLSLQCRN